MISRKRNLSIILITQNYFSKGKFARDIKNSSNYTVLLRNFADDGINKRVARSFGLIKSLESAQIDIQGQAHPYLFFDQSASGTLNNYRLYTKIFDTKKVYSKSGMPCYIISEKDFLSYFNIIHHSNNQVIAEQKDENEKSNENRSMDKKPDRTKSKKGQAFIQQYERQWKNAKQRNQKRREKRLFKKQVS